MATRWPWSRPLASAGAAGHNGGQVTASLSGDAAMHKQMRQWLGAEVEDFI
ncbi:hypothetical protein P4095_07255 [Pseudomonas aeruginosa]|nr:hypothetical protein [Pseudomonas aeruginosa]